MHQTMGMNRTTESLGDFSPKIFLPFFSFGASFIILKKVLTTNHYDESIICNNKKAVIKQQKLSHT